MVVSGVWDMYFIRGVCILSVSLITGLEKKNGAYYPKHYGLHIGFVLEMPTRTSLCWQAFLVP